MTDITDHLSLVELISRRVDIDFRTTQLWGNLILITTSSFCVDFFSRKYESIFPYIVICFISDLNQCYNECYDTI